MLVKVSSHDAKLKVSNNCNELKVSKIPRLCLFLQAELETIHIVTILYLKECSYKNCKANHIGIIFKTQQKEISGKYFIGEFH